MSVVLHKPWTGLVQLLTLWHVAMEIINKLYMAFHEITSDRSAKDNSRTYGFRIMYSYLSLKHKITIK